MAAPGPSDNTALRDAIMRFCEQNSITMLTPGMIIKIGGGTMKVTEVDPFGARLVRLPGTRILSLDEIMELYIKSAPIEASGGRDEKIEVKL